MDLWQITWFTVACASGATAIVLPPGVAVAWALARRRFTGRTLVETLVSLPLVMPPVATGLILLMLLSRRGAIGRILESAGIEVVFTWKAVVLAMAVMGLPLLVRTARAGFSISLPLAWPSIVAGAVLAFARALGEFGATIIVAGSIPGATRTLAVAIYSYTETGQDRQAGVLLVASASIAFLALWYANRLAERRPA